jgi:formate dehydrogenase major subunit
VPGLGTSLGRGGATTYQQDLANADCILIMGSNMAEAHPVGFQWVMEARERGAEVIHVDPRFTRTSACATQFVQLRAGTDIAFLGGVIHHILEGGREFREYVVNYTNAPVIIGDDYRDSEDLGGLFSGWQDNGSYDTSSWQYKGMEAHASAGQREAGGTMGEQAGHGGQGASLSHGEPPHSDPTLQDPRCVFQLLRRHYARYTPEFVERVCGVPQAQFLRVCEALCANSGRERTSAIAYAVGWTQHTVGVQIIRAAAIVQLLLGNIGRPGGGVMALRGHASIQGSTDIPTLYNILPGYIPMPHAEAHSDLAQFIELTSAPAGFWGHLDAYMTSLLKAYWGDAAHAGNDYCFDYLPRITGDHSHLQTTLAMSRGEVPGFIIAGENPVVGSANGRIERDALCAAEWVVVRDLFEVETAAFWKSSPEIESGELRTEDIATEVFFLPAAAHTEKSGSFTNTQRLLQWRHKAVEPEGDCRSDLWFYFHLGRLVREKLAQRARTDDRDRAILDLAWDYPTEGAIAEPSAEAVLREINGCDAEGRALSTYTELKADGSTSCGCWIYCGAYADDVNQTARRKSRHEQGPVAPEWGWAWPANRRILYNRASADPDGKPWSERKRYVWWDAGKERWTGEDVPDFEPDKRPDYVPPDGARAEQAIAGCHPFIMQSDGRGWLFAPAGVVDGPLPTHYEPHESPLANALYPQRANPARQRFDDPRNRPNPTGGEPGSEAYPFVLTTYRLTEHHTAGGMSRFLPYLTELQPEMFCEVSPELARERGLAHAGWATISTERGAIEARVMVTERLRSLTAEGRRVHHVGLPYHWGSRGLTQGGSANDLLPIVLDPNVHISETKVATCDIRPGRRGGGAA